MKDVKILRKVCKVTQTELADALGLDQCNYCNIENGKLIPNSLVAIKRRVISYLLPKLEEIIVSKSNELKELDDMRREFNLYEHELFKQIMEVK